MTQAITETDWKKHAAEAVANDDLVEIQFLEQAYSFIQNKARPLLEDPYRLGFEIVHKNDNASRMVGMFIFRVNKDLYYAPCFFINGEIKGTDLLYRQAIKLFTVLTNEWCEHLINRSMSPQGEGVSKIDGRDAPRSMDLRSIAYPPSHRGTMAIKSAVERILDQGDEAFDKEVTIERMARQNPVDHQVKTAAAQVEIREASEATWQALYDIDQGLGEVLKKEASEEYRPGQALREVITGIGLPAMEWIKAAMEQNYDFANALYTTFDFDDYMPPEAVEANRQKLASEKEGLEKRAAEAPKIVLHMGMTEATKSASSEVKAQIAVKNYWFEDTRKEASAVYRNDEVCLEGITDPGVYELLMRSGERERVCAATPFPDSAWCHRAGPGEPEVAAPYALEDEYRNASKMCLYCIGDKKLIEAPSSEVYGDRNTEGQQPDMGIKKPRKGKHYVLYLKDSGEMSPPFEVVGNDRSKNGLREYRVDTSCCEHFKEVKTLFINPDSEARRHEDGVYGTNAVFLELTPRSGEDEIEGREKFLSEKQPADPMKTDLHLLEHGAKAVTVKKAGDYFTVRGESAEEVQNNPEFGPIKTIAHLMLDHGMRQGQAEELLKEAAEKGEARAWVKEAASEPRLNGEARFETTHDPDYNVTVDEPQAFVIGTTHTDYSQLVPNESRFGDQQELIEAGKDVFTTTPNELYSLSQDRSLRTVFEHGVIGSMAQTFDAVSQVDKFLPDMERGNDRLARAIFLLHWKPYDFAQAYGSDDQSDLEEKFLSTFKQFGDLILELLKKSPGQVSGPTSAAQ